MHHIITTGCKKAARGSSLPQAALRKCCFRKFEFQFHERDLSATKIGHATKVGWCWKLDASSKCQCSCACEEMGNPLGVMSSCQDAMRCVVVEVFSVSSRSTVTYVCVYIYIWQYFIRVFTTAWAESLSRVVVEAALRTSVLSWVWFANTWTQFEC